MRSPKQTVFAWNKGEKGKTTVQRGGEPVSRKSKPEICRKSGLGINNA